MAVIQGKNRHPARHRKDMLAAAKSQQFEEAAHYRNQLRWLDGLGRQVILATKNFGHFQRPRAE